MMFALTAVIHPRQALAFTVKLTERKGRRTPVGDKYVAKKYVSGSSLIDRTIKCPNCHQPMTIAGRILYCLSSPKCKLQDVAYREVKSLTTIERVDSFRGVGQ